MKKTAFRKPVLHDFTLIELVVVTSIVAILADILLPAVQAASRYKIKIYLVNSCKNWYSWHEASNQRLSA